MTAISPAIFLQAAARQPSALDVAQTVAPGEGKAFKIGRVMGADLGDPGVSAREAALIAAQPSPMRDVLRADAAGSSTSWPKPGAGGAALREPVQGPKAPCCPMMETAWSSTRARRRTA